MEKFLILLLMDDLAASCDGAGRTTAGIVRVLLLVVLGLVGGGEDARTNVRIGTAVEGFLFAPQKISVRVLVEVRSELLGCASGCVQ